MQDLLLAVKDNYICLPDFADVRDNGGTTHWRSDIPVRAKLKLCTTSNGEAYEVEGFYCMGWMEIAEHVVSIELVPVIS